MKKVFTLSGKEKVLGKTRNVYMKANTKSKYIKYKGEFMKLNEYVKTAKSAKSAAPENSTIVEGRVIARATPSTTYVSRSPDGSIAGLTTVFPSTAGRATRRG
jgi:hypothetical protein